VIIPIEFWRIAVVKPWAESPSLDIDDWEVVKSLKGCEHGENGFNNTEFCRKNGKNRL